MNKQTYLSENVDCRKGAKYFLYFLLKNMTILQLLFLCGRLLHHIEKV